MPVHRVYFDGCPTAHALDLIGDRWALLIVRELLLGPKRFTDLRRGLPRMSRNVLSQRLDDLQVAEVLRRRTLPPPSASTVYELTHRGYELETVLRAIGRWGAESPSLPITDTLGVDTFVLGLRSRYAPVTDRSVNARYELRIGEEAFDFHIVGGQLTVRRGASDHPTSVIAVDPGALAAVARGVRPMAAALSTAGGDHDKLREFAGLFIAANGEGDGPTENTSSTPSVRQPAG